MHVASVYSVFTLHGQAFPALAKAIDLHFRGSAGLTTGLSSTSDASASAAIAASDRDAAADITPKCFIAVELGCGCGA